MSMFSMPISFFDFFVRSIKTLPYLAVTIGPLFFCIGIWMSYSSANFSRNSVAVEALVTTVEERRGDNGTVYRPTFEAEASNGNSIRYIGNTWVAPKPHEAGDIVAAYYDQASGIIRSKIMLNQLRFMGSSFMRIGGVFVLLGTIFFGWRRYSRSQQ
ncbi:DUF3592 domain-containing protein [uncultured Tateyamaria sp.]|uniref:DUF3592 domain-containing protein n=1 Tax=uncultured Tateyamaria sp. TaxID=455651 RepID=UPI002610471D|nr:DUF3592 domain-containing protein [uncultured Tateyamaria sp.]